MHLLLEISNDYSNDPTGAAGGAGLFWYIVTAIGMWPMLTKAGRPGWGGFIPIYNIYLQVKLAGYGGWLVLLYIIPFVNIVVAIIVSAGNARAFGHGTFYGVVLHFLFQPIGFLITGFGSSKYTGERL